METVEDVLAHYTLTGSVFRSPPCVGERQVQGWNGVILELALGEEFGPEEDPIWPRGGPCSTWCQKADPAVEDWGWKNSCDRGQGYTGSQIPNGLHCGVWGVMECGERKNRTVEWRKWTCLFLEGWFAGRGGVGCGEWSSLDIYGNFQNQTIS